MKNKKLEDKFNQEMVIIRNLEILYNQIVKGISLSKIKKEIRNIIRKNL